MSNDIKKILQSFEVMLNNKSVVSETALISPLDKTSVGSGFGPRWGKTHNGVDLAADAAEVKAPADGVVVKTAVDEYPCGGTVVIDHAGGFRTGFCHLQKINVKQGQQVKQGDIIAISGGGSTDPGHGRSDGRHLHFTLKKDGQLVNPLDYIDKSGVVMTGSVPQSTDTTTSTETSGDTTTKRGNLDIDMGKYSSIPDFATNAASQFKPNIKLTEQVDSQEKKYLQFCNVSTPSVRNGQQVGIGTTLGETDTDVVVTNFDSTNTRIKLRKTDFNLGKNVSEYLNTITIPKDSNKKIKSPVAGIVRTKYSQSCKNQITIEYETKSQNKTTRPGVKEPTFTDPLLGAILTAPLKVFKDKYDDSGNLKQKRFGYAGERVDPWIKDAIVAPFKKIGSLYGKEKTEEEVDRKKKKIDENIERIKKLL